MKRMHSLENYTMTPYQERNRKKKIIIGSSLLCLLLVVGTCVGVVYGKGSSKKDLLESGKESFSLVCSDVPDKDKLDCYPDAPVNASECINRGCCFSKPKNDNLELTLPPLNVPYCYYPSNYKGYAVIDVVETSRRLKIKLQRTVSSGFPKDISNLDVLVSYIDDKVLRIKITDADSQRYEVPTQLHYQTKKIIKPLYTVKFDNNTGSLSVLRSSTQSTIFKTNLARLVYSDQFLQLSSDLPTPYIYGIGEHYNSVLRSVNWTRFTLLNSDLSPYNSFSPYGVKTPVIGPSPVVDSRVIPCQIIQKKFEMKPTIIDFDETPNHALYGSHPFYMALEKDGKASGIFLHNSNIMDVILQPTPAITFRPIGGILDFYIMTGPSPNEVIQQYSDVIGKTFMPPFWSLGFHLCRWGYDSSNKTRETTLRTLAAQINLDVQWNDIDYMDQYKDFTYDKKNFVGLPEFVEELHSKGLHYVLMIDPGLSNSEKSYIPYDEGVDDGIFIRNANGSIFVGKVWTSGTTVYPDFSHPAAIPFWTRQFRRLYNDIKYDGVWIDMNEPSNFFDGGIDGCPDSSLEKPQYIPGGNSLIHKTVCMTAKHYHSNHYNEHNIYAYQEAVATYEAIKSVRNRRPFIISRASYPGQGVFSGHWSGDINSTWEDMRYTVRSMINFNMYGMPMIGSDICGFNYNTTVELCARWMGLGAFYPFSRNHNQRDTIEQDPVALGPIVVQATQIALQRRYTLLPTLYTLFYRSHVFGDAVIRPLFFEFPEDENTYAIDEQFLWGSSLMIVQVLYPNTSTVQAYFPKGLWYNAVTGEQSISSGEKMALNIPLRDIYLGVRGGVVLSSLKPGLTTTETRKNPFVLAAALDENQSASGELYWDDGDSLETYENGFYNLIKYQVKDGNMKSTVVNSGYACEMPLVSIGVIGYKKFPTEVTLNDHNCTYVNDSGNFTLNSTVVDSEFFADNSSIPISNVFGIGAVPDLTTEKDDFCQFLQLGPILVVQMQNTSLLSPLSVSWK